jgi:putative membrane protein
MNTSKVAMLGVGAWLGACLFGGAAEAADPPATADVLGKLHNANLTEIEAGKLAQDNGHSKATRDYGKMMATDATSADQEVMALAKEEMIDVSASTPVVGSNNVADLTAGLTFDHRFARIMVDDHKKQIAAVTMARDHTTDAKLKKLLTDLLPTLRKHESMAESLEKAK